jgi:hypothetical protein
MCDNVVEDGSVNAWLNGGLFRNRRCLGRSLRSPASRAANRPNCQADPAGNAWLHCHWIVDIHLSCHRALDGFDCSLHLESQVSFKSLKRLGKDVPRARVAAEITAQATSVISKHVATAWAASLKLQGQINRNVKYPSVLFIATLKDVLDVLGH